MLETVALWIVVALLTESLTEIFKTMFSEKLKDKATFATSLAIGITLAFAFSLNPFALAGVGAYVSTVCAGIIASRGANFLHDFVKKIATIGNESK